MTSRYWSGARYRGRSFSPYLQSGFAEVAPSQAVSVSVGGSHSHLRRRLLAQPVDGLELAPQVAHVGLDAHRASGGALDQLRRRELAAVLIKIVLEPVVERGEFTARDLIGNLRMAAARRLEELGAQDVAKRVALELAADHAREPVHVLEDAVAVVGHGNPQVGAASLAPG